MAKSNQSPNEWNSRNYYVDEAGDTNLFKSKGGIAIEDGSSRYFILGFLEVPYPSTLTRAMESLRANLLADPYFKGVPSFQPEEGKTAVCFHATKDLPEVRREVYKLLLKFDNLRFHAVVRDKWRILKHVRWRRSVNSSYRYHPNDLYDDLVARLFKNSLHKGEYFNIYFASRAIKDRTEALQAALIKARNRFKESQGIESNAPMYIECQPSRSNSCLQAADYYLWALQRLYEKQEDRYFDLMADQYSIIIDVDDTREHGYGRYYDRKKPLSLAVCEGRKDWSKDY